MAETATACLVTSKMIKAIKAACREAVGGRRAVEVGERNWPARAEDADGFNFLLWGAGHDLDSTEPIDGMLGKSIATSHGWVALDCYLYNLPMFGRDPEDALDCNCYVLIDPQGQVAYASTNDLEHVEDIDSILTAHGHARMANEE